ncbi:putative exosome complex exonuclease [Chloropicon primus]|uniref:Putative exosome complex exonuclease n=1 Tax=Chloropicon primus TaxID=1764295 RepID=A0A5B8MZ67_9CHLO|nr:putative exosome complex exonuclease [Chloropicon primus]|eukprot:QDZ24975.1 putative exosome complex exonuclease [Chloropicon primus]
MVLVAESEVVCPGDKLGRDNEDCVSGANTHVYKGYVIASTLGKLVCEQPSKLDFGLDPGSTTTTTTTTMGEASGKRLPVVSIRAEGSKPGQGEESVGALSIGDEVLCRVKRLNPRYASCDISCKGNSPLIKEFLGIIRVQDVRATEIDKVSILSSFRPGDIVRAEVISLGESQSLLLSTAKDHLGVLHAKSEQGETMVQVSPTEMLCPVTKAREERKIAQ